MKIFIIDKDGNRDEITEWLYWFEEESIRNYNDLTHHGYIIEFELNGVVVWTSKESE